MLHDTFDPPEGQKCHEAASIPLVYLYTYISDPLAVLPVLPALDPLDLKDLSLLGGFF